MRALARKIGPRVETENVVSPRVDADLRFPSGSEWARIGARFFRSFLIFFAIFLDLFVFFPRFFARVSSLFPGFCPVFPGL